MPFRECSSTLLLEPVPFHTAHVLVSLALALISLGVVGHGVQLLGKASSLLGAALDDGDDGAELHLYAGERVEPPPALGLHLVAVGATDHLLLGGFEVVLLGLGGLGAEVDDALLVLGGGFDLFHALLSAVLLS